MKKLLILSGRLMTFFCLAMVALFVCGFFFWSETEASKLASQVIIIFFSLMGFFAFCIDSTAKNAGSACYRQAWEGSESEEGLSHNGVCHAPN